MGDTAQNNAVDRLMAAGRKITDGRFSAVTDSWTAALNMSETISRETTVLQRTMNLVMIAAIVGTLIVGVLVWNSEGSFKVRLTVTLVLCLLVTSLLNNLMYQIRDSLGRISRESTGIVYGFAHAMSLANIVNAADMRYANQGLLTAETSAAAASAARTQMMGM